MTNIEMAKTFIEAYKVKKVIDLEYASCPMSTCPDCPANKACTQLAGKEGKYFTFQRNYTSQVLPLIDLKTMDVRIRESK